MFIYDKNEDSSSNPPRTLPNNISYIPTKYTVVLPFNQKILVHYTIKPDYVIDRNTYTFYHSEGGRATVTINDSEETKCSYEKPVAEIVDKHEIENYLRKLISLEYETNVNVSID